MFAFKVKFDYPENLKLNEYKGFCGIATMELQLSSHRPSSMICGGVEFLRNATEEGTYLH